MEDSEYSPPSFLVAANTHNVANGNEEDSWFDAATLGTASVVTSAAVQTLNILPTVGNWLGGDFSQLKTQEVLNDFDSDLGKYYERHQEGVDALGFALGSVVPGMAGVKVLKAGQLALRTAAEAGNIGNGMRAAFGLIKTEPKLLAQAVEAALKPNAGFPILNTETVKAMAAGFGQSALEGAAWETAVAATMYNGPVLQGQDLGDITTNILWGAGAFGVLGGTLHSAGIYSKIKSAEKVFEAEIAPWNIIHEGTTKMSTADKILNYLEQKHNMPEVPTGRWAGDEAWKVGKVESVRADKLRIIDYKVRTAIGELSGGDQIVAERLYHDFGKMELGQIEAKLYGSESYSRIGTKSTADSTLTKLEQKVATTGYDSLTAEESAHWLSRTRTYTKVTGENAGKILEGKTPEVLRLADTLGKEEVISITQKGVTAGRKHYKFALGETFDTASASHYEAEARQLWASRLENFTETEIRTKAPVTVGYRDIALLDKAYIENVLPRVETADGSIREFLSRAEYRDFLDSTKYKLTTELVTTRGASFEEAAKITNTTEQHALGVRFAQSPEKGMFAHQEAEAAYNKGFADAGVRPSVAYHDSPSWLKSVKDSTNVTVDNNVVTGLIAIKQKQVLAEQAADRAVAPILGEDVNHFLRIPDSVITRMNRSGVGGGMLGVQNENMGTLGSMCQYLGSQTLKTIQRVQAVTREKFSAPLYQLANKPEAAIEWSVLQNRLRQYGEVPFGYDAEQQAMRPLAIMRAEKAALGTGEEVKEIILPEGIPEIIPVKHPETIAVIEDHISSNASRVSKLAGIRANQGVTWNRDPERFYPIPPNTRDFPFIASVIDDSIAGAGHGKMLYAASYEDLERQITSVRSADPTLKVLTKKDAENWYKSVGQYEYERTLTDISFDTSKGATGKSASYLPSTDPQKIVADTLNWHLARDSALIREAVAHQNEAQIATLRTMGEKYSNVQSSHFNGLDALGYLELQGKNPFGDYVRSMLGLSTAKEFPFWSPLNEMLDRKVSSVFNRVYEAFSQAKSPAELATINTHLAEAGYQGAAYDAMTVAQANHTAPAGALSAFIAKANAILSSTMLGLDPINALNNTIGSVVLRSTELKSLIRAIESGNSSVAGELAGLSKIKVPGTNSTIFSPAKMYAAAMRDFHSPEGLALRAEFTSRGIISSRVEQANWVLENLALTGKESAAQLDSTISKVFSGLKTAAAKGEKLTGNTLAEEFNRFVSGHVVKQITDAGVKAGLLGEKEAWAYINTFVNRVEGNYIAAQRPGIFQGPIGQAIGLFQTYQFNLIQQLLRHVGEGGAKDAAMMMGLQSTIFGMKGLPAFDAINTHLIGNASGNTQHRDLYNTVFGAAGKEAGDWLMYGVGSNALGLISPELKLNLYSRGDINPRNVTLLPVNPANIPFVQATAKFWGSAHETATKIAQGGEVWSSMLQGLEHAGVSRPLAGLAATLQAAGNPSKRAYTTSNAGNVVASNDFLSLTSLIRITGAKPLDEAIGVDRAFNLDVYAAKDSADTRLLGETVKTTLIGGNQPTQEQIEKFSYLYAHKGGRPEQFNKFMLQQYKSANTSQVNRLAENLKSPFSQSMQQIMGGNQLADFHNTGGQE